MKTMINAKSIKHAFGISYIALRTKHLFIGNRKKHMYLELAS